MRQASRLPPRDRRPGLFSMPQFVLEEMEKEWAIKKPVPRWRLGPPPDKGEVRPVYSPGGLNVTTSAMAPINREPDPNVAVHCSVTVGCFRRSASDIVVV